MTLSLAAARPAVAEGDPRPALWEFLTVERYTQTLLQVAVLALRDQIDFTYTDISSDFPASTVSMHGVKLYPDVPWASEKPCVIEAERVSIAGGSLAEWDSLRVRLALYGATASPACAMPPLDQQLAAAGLQQIDLDRFEIDLNYKVGPGRLLLTTNVTLAKLASVNLNLDFEYFAVREDEDIVAYLSNIAVVYEDLGLWAVAKQFLPPDFSDPEMAAQIVQAGLTDALQSAIDGPQSPRRSLSQDQHAFVMSASRQAKRFVANPGTITIEANPSQSVFINTEALENFGALFAELKPTVAERPSSRSAIVDAAKLRKALTAPQTLSDDERRTIGQALVAGVGAPKSVSAGRALLEPLAAAGDAKAAIAVANAMKDEDPQGAYRLALQAGAAKAEGASRVLDGLERNLTTPEVLRLQAEGLEEPDAAGFTSLSEIRSRAVAHLSGLGQRRSYRRALFWASLAAATGDAAAQSLIGDIEDRMRYRGDAAAAAWRTEADAAAQAALDAWLSQNLATKFASGR